jgi:hypothetical protein
MMTYPKAPPHHVWQQAEPGLWKCQYCNGFRAGKYTPHQEAHATTEEKARLQLAKPATQSAQEDKGKDGVR